MAELHAPLRVLLLDTKRSNPNHYICLSIAKALRDHPGVLAVYEAHLGNALELAQSNDCNLFLAFDGEELHRGICARLKAVCGKAVLWVTEDPYEIPVNVRNASLFDHVFTNDSASVGAYPNGAVHLPLAGGGEFQYFPVQPDEQCRYDLFFAGTAWPNRVSLLRELSDSLQGLRTKLALSVNPHLPQVDLRIPVSAYNWRTPNSQFARFANASRAVLTLHRDFSASPGAPTAAATPGPRLFEVALAGGFQLVDASLPEVGRYFEPDREIVLFDSPADCVEKLRHYLAHPAERVAIARAAQERALREHTYAHRIDALIKSLTPQQYRSDDTPGVTPRQRPRVLMVSHNILGAEAWGGVEVYQDWLRRTLAQDYDVWTYAPLAHSNGRTCVLFDHELKEVDRITFSTPSGEALLSCPQRERAFSRLLQQHRIQLVHVQHLIRHVPSLPLIARALGIPTVWSLHDYYGVCQEFNLIGAEGRFCEVERRDESYCDICLSRSREASRGGQARRRAFMRLALESATVLHANTVGVRRRYESVYGTLTGHRGWAIMGVPLYESQAAFQGGRSKADRLRVVIPGNFTRQKGAEMLAGVMRLLRDEPIDILILGRVDPAWTERLQRTGNPNVSVHGAYEPAEAERLLAQADVSIHASIWPETYCLTLSEAFRAGVVPIVTDIGALGERVRHGVNGLKFDLDAPDQLVQLLVSLASAPEQLEALRRGILASDYVEHRAHEAWARELYQQLIARSVQVAASGGPDCELTLADCAIALNEPIWLEQPPPADASPMSLPDRPSVPMRALLYLGRNGVRATAKRVWSEALVRSGFGGTGKQEGRH